MVLFDPDRRIVLMAAGISLAIALGLFVNGTKTDVIDLAIFTFGSFVIYFSFISFLADAGRAMGKLGAGV